MKHLKFIILIILLSTLTGCSYLTNSRTAADSQNYSQLTKGALPTRNLITPEPTVKTIPLTTEALKPSIVNTPIPTMTATTNSPANSTDYVNIAKELLKSMSLKEKVGQIFLARCNEETAVNDIKTWYLGGFVLFSDNFSKKTKSDVVKTIQNYQNVSNLPMLISVDEEGGIVNRISKYKEFRTVPFKSPQELYTIGGYNLIIKDTKEKAQLLKSLGINVNLAPVCDISTDPKDFMYKRTFGKDANATSKYVTSVVSTMQSEGIGSTLKHFPGYGRNTDTHTGTAIDNRSYSNFKKNDFLPFQAGIKAGAGSVLVSHVITNALGKDYPASLSPSVHQILREELHFDGVIMTDDLSMGAIKKYSTEKAAVLAVSAGNDLILTSDYDIQIPAVLQAIKDKKITESRIDEAVMRILLWKLSLHVISE